MPDPMTTTSASFGIGERDEDDDEDADDGVAGDSDAEEADAQGVVCVRWRRTRGEMTVDAARGRGWQVIIGPRIALAVELSRVGSFIVVVVVVVCQVIAQVIAELAVKVHQLVDQQQTGQSGRNAAERKCRRKNSLGGLKSRQWLPNVSC